MLLDVNVESIIEQLGHNGSKILWPNDHRPNRGFSIQEIVDVAWDRGFGLVEIEACPVITDSNGEYPIQLYGDVEERITHYMQGRPGLVMGEYAPDRCHMVAWDGERIYDPMDARVYGFADIGIPKIAVQSFFAAIPRGIKS